MANNFRKSIGAPSDEEIFAQKIRKQKAYRKLMLDTAKNIPSAVFNLATSPRKTIRKTVRGLKRNNIR